MIKMANDLFSDIRPLKSGLDAAWLRNQVIANNIANADTPGFKRSEVDFETLYKSALGEGDGDGFALKKTRPGHMDIGSSSPAQARVTQDDSTTMRMDGNNVDIDKEMVDLAINQIYYDSLQTKVNSEYNLLRTAINEGR